VIGTIRSESFRAVRYAPQKMAILVRGTSDDAAVLARIFKVRSTRSGRFDTEKRSFDAPGLPPHETISGP